MWLLEHLRSHMGPRYIPMGSAAPGHPALPHSNMRYGVITCLLPDFFYQIVRSKMEGHVCFIPSGAPVLRTVVGMACLS